MRSVKPPVDSVAVNAARLRAMGRLIGSDAGRVRALMAHFKSSGLQLESEIRGWSMTGSLPAGSRIRIRCEHLTGIPEGCVVAFMSGTTLIAHRIAHRGRERAAGAWAITRGDATLLPDAPIGDADVVGRVVAVAIDESWRDVPAAPPRHRPLLSALVLRACTLALVFHPMLASALAGGLWRWKALREACSPPSTKRTERPQ